MNIFLAGFHEKIGVDIFKKLRERNVHVCYWIVNNRFPSQYREEFLNTVFHNSHDAMSNIPAKNTDPNIFSSPDEKIIAYLHDDILLSFAMMDKINHSHFDSMRKLRIYYNQIAYWNSVIKKFNPHAIIFSDLPHILPKYILYKLAKYYGIRTIIIKNAKGLPDRLLFFNDFTSYTELNQKYEFLKKQDFGIESLGESIRKYYTDQTKENTDLKKYYVASINSKSKAGRIFPEISKVINASITLTLPKTALNYIKMMFRKTQVESLGFTEWYGWQMLLNKYRWNTVKKNYKEEYYLLIKEFDQKEKYVYVPLHFQPECNTNPMGGAFQDQLLMVEMLSAALPSDWKIYIREHPMQWYGVRGYLGRYRGYYRELSNIKGVRLIDPSIPTPQLIEHMQAVATVTGTTGWEAILKQKPALVFGYVWYMGSEGIFRVNSVSSCKQAIAKIQSGYRPDMKKVVQFLGAVEQVSFYGYIQERFKINGLDPEENKLNVYNKLVHELTK